MMIHYFADGQHQSIAASNKGIILDVKVVAFDKEDDTPENVTKYIAALNNVKTSWGTNDYMGIYASNGIPEYQLFAQLKGKYGFTVTDLTHIFLGSGSNKTYKSGTMKFEDEKDSLTMARQIARMMKSIPNKAFCRRKLPSIMKGCDYKVFADAVIEAAKMLKSGGSTGFPENQHDFAAHMERIKEVTFKMEVA